MTLISRIREVGNSADSDRPADAPISPAQLRMLLQEHIPSEKLAKMVAENPTLAENEVRSVCRRLFEEDVLPGMARCGDYQRERLADALVDGIFGFGPIEGLLADRCVTEVMVNGMHSVYYERGGVLYPSGKGFSSEEEIRALIDRIIGPLGRRIDESSPMVNARLDDGSRVNAVIPPISRSGPLLTIRRFSDHVITLREMVGLGSIDEPMEQFLTWAVVARKNIAVSGGTGTGKTTLLNALSCEIPGSERVITIEDSAELRFLGHPHVVSLEARPMNAEGEGEVSIRQIVMNALRMRPDRIVVGECRGAEALDMLQAMNTGHDGSLTTLHANSPEDALLRLMTMVRYAAELPVDVIERQIASALDLGVQIARDAAGNRFVTQVVEYHLDPDRGKACVEVVYERAYADTRGEWRMVPVWVDELETLCLARRGEVELWKHSIS